MNEKKESGVLTLEAAILMPLFIILMLMLDGLFVLFMGQQVMVHTAVQTARSMAFDPYASGRVDSSDNGLSEMFTDIFGAFSDGHTSTWDWSEESHASDVRKIAAERFVTFLRPNISDAEALLEEIGVRNGIGGLDFSESSVSDGYLLLKIKYTQDFPLNVADLTSFKREISLKVKLFDWEEI